MEHWLQLHEYRNNDLVREARDAERLRRRTGPRDGTTFLPRPRRRRGA
jgi:hypothetical protein